MLIESKHKGVLSRTVIYDGNVLPLHVVRRNESDQTLAATPFDFETESTIMVDFPVVILNQKFISKLMTTGDMDTLIKQAKLLSESDNCHDTAVLLSPGKITVLNV